MGKRKASLGGQLADMDLKLLRIFKAVADNKGISAAEDELNIATSTISNYLSDLERRLDMRLCQRGRKGFSLTEQGETVYSAILELLAAIELFQGRIKGSQERLTGSLQVGLAESVSFYHNSPTPELLQSFTHAAPDVHMDLQIYTAETIPRAVLDERLHLGISYATEDISGLELYPLHKEHILLFCGKQHPLYKLPDSAISLEDIEKQKLVETPRLKRSQELRPQAERWYFQAYAPTMEARALLIKTGNFLAYLPQEYVNAMGMEADMRPLLPDELFYINDYYVMTRKGRHLSPIVERFLSCLPQANQAAKA